MKDLFKQIRWTRRDLLATSAVFFANLFLWPKQLFAKKIALKLSQLPDLQKVGGSTSVNIKGFDILLIHDTAENFYAIDPNCTHKKCKVRYLMDKHHLACKCHRSSFLLDGSVTGGPAPRPLASYPIEIRQGEQIIITLPNEAIHP